MAWFKQWFGTKYYAMLYGHRDRADAAAWVNAILQRWQLPQGAHVLDLGCGRGRHARCLIEHGMRVTGIDISMESIAEARSLAGSADFRVQDMREPLGVATFDAACCLFTSLGYFDRKQDDELVFRNVMRALRPGGRFVLDFMNTPAVLRDLVTSEVVDKDGVRFRIDRSVEDGVLVKRIEVTEKGRAHGFEERVQALDPSELEEMAQGAGLEIEARTDGPVLTPFDPQRSGRFVLWARKPMA